MVRTDEGDAHLTFLLDITLVPCPAERGLTRDGPCGPVFAAAKQVDLKGVRARCACSRHVARNMVGSGLPRSRAEWAMRPQSKQQTSSSRAFIIHMALPDFSFFYAIVLNSCVGAVSAYLQAGVQRRARHRRPRRCAARKQLRRQTGNTQSEHIWVQLVLNRSM